eukprot:1100921-Amorphochlora_amoeboformis.AAC.1
MSRYPVPKMRHSLLLTFLASLLAMPSTAAFSLPVTITGPTVFVDGEDGFPAETVTFYATPEPENPSQESILANSMPVWRLEYEKSCVGLGLVVEVM